MTTYIAVAVPTNTTVTARIAAGFSTSISSTYTSSIDPSSTMILVFDCGGTLASTTVYKQSAGSASTPTVTTISQTAYAYLGHDLVSCCANLSTAAISGATYAWYTSSDNYTTPIAFATSNTLAGAQGTKTYKVKVTVGSCIAEDYVLVTQNGANCCKMMSTGAVISEEKLELLQNIPNPTEGTTVIPYNLTGETEHAEIIIMDIFGKVIERIPISADKNETTVDCNKYSNGIYFYSMTADGKRIGVKKMIIAK